MKDTKSTIAGRLPWLPPELTGTMFRRVAKPKLLCDWLLASETHSIDLWRSAPETWTLATLWALRPSALELRNNAALRARHARAICEAASDSLAETRRCAAEGRRPSPRSLGILAFFRWRVRELMPKSSVGGRSRMRYGYFSDATPRPKWLRVEDERRDLLAVLFEHALRDGDANNFDACHEASLGTTIDYLSVRRCLGLVEEWSRKDAPAEARVALARHGRDLLSHVLDGWQHLQEGSAGEKALWDWSAEALRNSSSDDPVARELLASFQTAIAYRAASGNVELQNERSRSRTRAPRRSFSETVVSQLLSERSFKSRKRV